MTHKSNDLRLLNILNNHGVIAFPTDTVYGFGCDPLDPVALRRIHEIKGREMEKGFLVLIDHPYQVFHYVTHVPQYAEKLMAEYWPGSLTLIFKARADLPLELCGEKRTIGVRLSSHPLARHIASILPHGIVSTSANVSGKDPATSGEDVANAFGPLLDEVLFGECGAGIHSTVVDCTGYEPRLVRAGAVDLALKDLTGDGPQRDRPGTPRGHTGDTHSSATFPPGSI